jgi:hypothetical protein
MKKTLLSGLLCLYTLFSIGQNIFISPTTPIAHCNGGNITVSFSTLLPGPYTIRLGEYYYIESEYCGFGPINYNIISTTTTENTSDILNIPIDRYTRYQDTQCRGGAARYGYSYVITVISSTERSREYPIKLYNESCPPILAARAPSSVPKNAPVAVDVAHGPTGNARLQVNQTIFQLSDKFGSFNNPTILSIHPSSNGKTNVESTTYLLDLPSNIIEGTGYKIKVLSTEPVSEQTTNSFAITGPLPVNLISFSAKNIQNGNLLKWETSSETNSQSFEVQRSTDAKAFETIGKVIAKGNSNEKLGYEFLHNTPPKANIIYYRLKQIDLDGKFEYSKIISVVSEEKLGLKVFPNPVSDILTIENSKNKSLNLNLLNAMGSSFAQLQNVTDSQIKMNLKTVPAGIYFLQIVDGKQFEYQKVLKH